MCGLQRRRTIFITFLLGSVMAEVYVADRDRPRQKPHYVTPLMIWANPQRSLEIIAHQGQRCPPCEPDYGCYVAGNEFYNVSPLFF